MCIGTREFVTDWQKLQVGIMAGCTISPLAFTMEMVIRASKWVVGGERRLDGLRLPPIRAFMDDMTLNYNGAMYKKIVGKDKCKSQVGEDEDKA